MTDMFYKMDYSLNKKITLKNKLDILVQAVYGVEYFASE